MVLRYGVDDVAVSDNVSVTGGLLSDNMVYLSDTIDVLPQVCVC